MTINPNSSKTVIPSSHVAGGEIDLREILNALLRHKYLIAKISGVAVLLSGFNAFTQKPVWEGQFEIVVSTSQSNSYQSSTLLKNNSTLANIIGISGGNSQLNTEVEILESPSVLKPVFDFVKQQKQKQGIDTKDWRYAKWLNNLEINLVDGTSVLELAYRDTDKDLVLPVIQKISETYQEYSGRDRERGIAQGIKYLDQQIAIYATKSLRSLRAVQEFGIEQDLTVFQSDGADNAIINNSVNIEEIRIEASNQIRNIDELLKKLTQSSISPDEAMQIGRSTPGISSQALAERIDYIDIKLAELKGKYTDQDESIRTSIEKRRLLIDAFNRNSIRSLYAQRSAAQARLKSAERPKGILIKYRELLRTAARDEATLNRLESERQIMGLEQARKKDPWALISNPTLLDSPVAPSKKRIVALGLLAGLIAGSGAALFVDHRTGLVYSQEELKKLVPCPMIRHLPAMGDSTWTDAADLLAAGPLAKTPGHSAIALIPIGNIPNDQLQAFSAELRRALRGRELLVSTDIRQTSRCATQLLVTSQGVATRIQLSQLRQKLALQGTPLAGWVLIDPELNLG